MHPILFHYGFFTIYSWGFMVALAIIIGVFLIYRAAARQGLDPNQILDGAFWTVLAGFIGGRLCYVLFFWKNYLSRPWEAFFIWQGGLAFFGAIGAGLLAAGIYLKIKKMPVLKTLDFITPYIALAYAVGRIGCFLNGCCYGKISELPWAVHFPLHPGLRHPTQLYSSLAGLLIFLFLIFWKKHQKFPGQIFYFGVLLSFGLRFFIEFLREDPPYYFDGINALHLTAAAVVVIFVIVYLFASKSRVNRGS